MRLRIVQQSLLAIALSFLLPVGLLAQAAAVRLEASARTTVLDSIISNIVRSYVDADTAQLIGAHLQARRAAGAYDRIDNPAQFAEEVTRDLRGINGDLHLSLAYSPDPAGQRAATNPLAGDNSLLNFGLTRAEILEGNVGYLEMTIFAPGPGWEEAVADAMRFLSRTDAIILDVRRHVGGASQMSHLVFSHFLGAEPVPTIRQRRRGAEPTTARSFAAVPGPRRPDIPLFVLTSRNTGSAGEEFAFVLKHQGRATLVGTRTAGAGNTVGFRAMGHGFTLGFSLTRVSDPATGTEWEHIGVQPDVNVPSERALLVAHEAALRAIKERVPARAAQIDRTLLVASARVNPRIHPPEVLARLAGLYQGRLVAVHDGKLTYARVADGPAVELVPLDDGRFAAGTLFLEFREEEGRMTLRIEQPNGNVVRFVRTP